LWQLRHNTGYFPLLFAVKGNQNYCDLCRSMSAPRMCMARRPLCAAITIFASESTTALHGLFFSSPRHKVGVHRRQPGHVTTMAATNPRVCSVGRCTIIPLSTAAPRRRGKWPSLFHRQSGWFE
jgi:hypothetical protein